MKLSTCLLVSTLFVVVVSLSLGCEEDLVNKLANQGQDNDKVENEIEIKEDDGIDCSDDNADAAAQNEDDGDDNEGGGEI